MDFKKIKKIVWILVISFLIKLISLNQSLWLDEAISANVVKNYNFWEIVTNFSVNDFHPPLYYWILKLWTSIFGLSEISLRLPSVIFSLVTIYFIYLIGKKIKDEKTGLWAAALTGFNPLLVYYSQEARMYLLVTMFLTINLYFFMRVIAIRQLAEKQSRSGSPRFARDGTGLWNIILFNIFSFLSFTTFYGSIFLLISFAIYLLIKKKFKLLLLTNIGIIIAILILTPLLRVQIINSKIVLTQVKNWRLVLGNVDFKNLLLFPIKFSIGRISFYPKKIYYLIGGFWSLIVFWQVFKGMTKNKFLGFLFIAPLIFGIFFSFFSPLMQYFRFLFLIPIMCLLIAIRKNNKKIIFLGFLIFSLIYLLNQKMHREDWKSLVANLLNNQNIYMISSFSDPIKFYRNDINIKDLKSEKITEKVITVVPYGEEIHGLNHNQKLATLGYQKIETKNFREITLEDWKLK